MACSKCGCTKIEGPRYVTPGQWGSTECTEALRYTCERCGFFWDEPTLEQKRIADAEGDTL